MRVDGDAFVPSWKASPFLPSFRKRSGKDGPGACKGGGQIKPFESDIWTPKDNGACFHVYREADGEDGRLGSSQPV